MAARYAVGIDLGTTNSVLAYVELGAEEARVDLLPIPQLVAASTLEERAALPSFLYLPTQAEEEGSTYSMAWGGERGGVVGELARRRSAEVPARTVAAAKSWLCHSRVDRRSAILPWQAPEEVPKISPLEASRRYLRHLVAAWNHAFPRQPIDRQSVVLTVPASFDASARELTREAALGAGLPVDLLLLEEPQAALYSWLAEQGEDWRKDLSQGDRLLVVDVGGGTTDFSLIGVESEGGELTLERVAVGDHILVGGDNMDLTLAHLARVELAEKGVDVDPWQAVGLWHACRGAKENLLAGSGPERHPVTVLGRGSRLIGGTVSVDLEREKVAATLLDGFFPRCSLQDRPARASMSGFREIGLPFEADTAVSRHLARFLSRHGEAAEALRPTHILFNGGVFKAPAMRERVMEALGGWFGELGAPRLLAGRHDLDDAVARGAAYYGFTRLGRGIRIQGGTARSYYVGVESSGLAIPGEPRPLRALCVVPQGMEEGSETTVPGGEIGLAVGEPAHFRFFSSTTRKEDRPGQLLEAWREGELVETDSLEAVLNKVEDSDEDFIPVRFRSRITELGTLELWCHSTVGEDRWKMEFSIRDS